MTKNNNRLKKKVEQAIKERMKDDEAKASRLSFIFNTAIDEMENSINRFYSYYADKENITVEEAKKIANETDIKNFEAKAAKYVRNKDFSERANKEMRLYNMKMKVSRMKLLEQEMALELAKLGTGVDDYLKESFKDANDKEVRRQAGILGMSAGLTEAELAAVTAYGFKKGNFSDAIWKDMKKLKKNLVKSVTASITQGKNPQALIKELRKETGATLYNAKRILVTVIGNVQTEVAKKSAQKAGYNAYAIVTEPSACKSCEARDGQIYKLDDLTEGVNAPMFHPNCRCSIYPVSTKYNDWE